MRMRLAAVLPLLLLIGGAWAEADEEVELTAAMHNNKVKWESHIRLHDQPLHATPVEDHAVIPLTVRATRRKRCSCGCQGCDLFPNRPCCSAACCSSAPMPLACCPPPPPPKPCCQPAFGPCCPATPNCCDKPCCKGRRPEWEDEEEEEGGAAPSQPPSGEVPRACCPASSPPPPPPSPPPPPPPPPEPPVECCGDDEPKGNPCDQMRPNPCGRPCCYYQNPSCCDQNAGRKPCCPPQQPCCPELPPLPAIGCCSVVPPCLRACPTCPCRKRVMLGKRAKRDDGLHCQACPAPKELQGEHLGQHLARSPKTAYKKLEPESDLVLESPRAGKLFQQSREERARRVKRMNCQICLNGQPIIRKKRSLDCVACTYLQPAYPQRRKARAAGLLPHELFGDDDHSPVGVPLVREKRDSCLPHPQCTMSGMVRRYKRNLLGSQYCEPCGGHYGRKKREAERETCMKEHRERTKRAAMECDRDEFDDDLDRLRMKRQAYQPNGLLDVAKLLTKSVAASQAGPGGCLRFPACVMAKKRRRKRQADRMEQYHKAVAEHKVAVAAHEEALVRHKRQFFTPDQSASCVPCPAWVTLALASRKKRSADNSTIEEEPVEHMMSLSEAIQDIRRKEGYELGFEEEEKDVRRKPRRRHGSCQQTEDCLNEVEYAIFRKVYHNHKRVKRSSKKKCTQCGHGTSLAARVKRSFGPDTNASEHACMAFPQCRTRVKRTIFNDCNICTPNLNRRRKKRNFGTPQCYPCNPGE